MSDGQAIFAALVENPTLGTAMAMCDWIEDHWRGRDRKICDANTFEHPRFAMYFWESTPNGAYVTTVGRGDLRGWWSWSTPWPQIADEMYRFVLAHRPATEAVR